jgi:hypothetical protein
MGEYITLSDINDEILPCAESDVLAANSFIERAAFSLGVEPASIATPAPFIVKRLGICFACYNRALLLVGTDATVIFDGARGQTGEDIYAQKRKIYLDETQRIQDSLTAGDFTGARDGGSGRVVNLCRA